MYRKILSLVLIISFDSFSALPPTVLSGQSQTIKPTTFSFKTPYSQATQISGIESLIETGSENMLVNPGFEGGATVGVANGWTSVAGTNSVTSTSSEITSGKKAQKIILSANSLGFIQEVLTPSGIQKQGVVGIAYATTVSTFQVCARIDSDAAKDICVPSNRLILDGLYHTVEIPFVFGTTSAGIYIKSASASGTVLLDAAYIKQGLGLQNLQGDTGYSAQVDGNSSPSTVSDENKDWLNGNCTRTATGIWDCPVISGTFTTVPNCFATRNIAATAAGFSPAFDRSLSTTTNLRFHLANEAGTAVNSKFDIICQKSGNDYLAASSNVYASQNANYDWTSYTPTFTGLGTVSPSTNQCKQMRDGSDLVVNCSLTTGTVAASLFSISLPAGLVLDTAKIIAANTTASPGQSFGIASSAGSTNATSAIVSATGTSTSLMYVGTPFSGASNLTPQNGSTSFASSSLISIYFRVPISGWSNSNVIVGSFQDVPTVPSAGARIDIFSYTYGTTNTSTVCSGTPCFVDQIGSAVSSIARGGTGTYTDNYVRTYAKLKCSASTMVNGVVEGTNSTGTSILSCSNCNSLTRITNRRDTGTSADTSGTILCQGTY